MVGPTQRHVLAIYGLTACLVGTTHAAEIAVEIDCPDWERERAAEFEARARAELAVQSLQGALTLNCGKQVRLTWTDASGERQESLAPDAENELLLEALNRLLRASPSSPVAAPPEDPVAAPPEDPGSPVDDEPTTPAAQRPPAAAEVERDSKPTPEARGRSPADVTLPHAGATAHRLKIGASAFGSSLDGLAAELPAIGAGAHAQYEVLPSSWAGISAEFGGATAQPAGFGTLLAGAAGHWRQDLGAGAFATLAAGAKHLFLSAPRGAQELTEPRWFGFARVDVGYRFSTAPQLLLMLQLELLPREVTLLLDDRIALRLSHFAPGVAIGVDWTLLGTAEVPAN